MSDAPSGQRVAAVATPTTAAQAVTAAARAASDLAGPGATVAVYVVDDSPPDAQMRARIGEAAGDALAVTVEALEVRAVNPGARAAELLEALGPDVARIVVAADVRADAARLRDRVPVDVVGRTADARQPLLTPGGGRRAAWLFALAFGFYLSLGGFTGGLDLLTGAVSAGVVAFALARVTFERPPALPRTALRAARTLVFLPVLLWAVARANLAIAAVILHPDLPVDPAMRAVETGATDPLERVVLANSVTLTPGTLTVDVRADTFLVHSLTGDPASVRNGRLQRLLAWVFHGRSAPESGGDGE